MMIDGRAFDSCAVDQVYVAGNFMGQGRVMSRSSTRLEVEEYLTGAIPRSDYSLRVRNCDGALSNAAGFAITQPAPVLHSMNPSAVPAATIEVTLNGANFDSCAREEVLINGSIVMGSGEVLNRSATQLVIRHRLTGAISGSNYSERVINCNGDRSNAVGFTIR